MITILANDFNTLTQESYDSLVFQKLQIHQLVCPCCNHAGFFIMHGSYKRTIKSAGSSFRLTVQRVFCKHCQSTHALLPASIVPYSQISLSEQVHVINLYENSKSYDDVLNSNPFIDENNIKSIIRSYVRHWLERLRSFSVPKYPLSELISASFAHYFRQFMQIKRTTNSLFVAPT